MKIESDIFQQLRACPEKNRKGHITAMRSGKLQQSTEYLTLENPGFHLKVKCDRAKRALPNDNWSQSGEALMFRRQNWLRNNISGKRRDETEGLQTLRKWPRTNAAELSIGTLHANIAHPNQPAQLRTQKWKDIRFTHMAFGNCQIFRGSEEPIKSTNGVSFRISLSATGINSAYQLVHTRGCKKGDTWRGY